MLSEHRAPLYEEETYGGRVRLRCTECDKVAYLDEKRATQAADTIRRQPRKDVKYMRPYLGRCGWWHVTRDLKAQRRRRNDA